MNRRNFFERMIAGTAGVGIMAGLEIPAMGFVGEGQSAIVDVDMQVRREPASASDVALSKIAQHLLTRLHALVPYPCILHESQPSGRDGLRIGHTVTSYQPGPESFNPPTIVTISHQVGEIIVVPSHRTEGRRTAYDFSSDRLYDVPDVVADPVEFAKLEPLAKRLSARIVAANINVFSPEMLLPRLGGMSSIGGPDCEGVAGIASRNYGLALRVVRQLCKDDLLMRVDLIGGRYPEPSDD